MRTKKKPMSQFKIGDLICVNMNDPAYQCFGVVTKKTKEIVGIYWTDDNIQIDYEKEDWCFRYRVLLCE